MYHSTKGIDIRGANRVVGGMHIPQLELGLLFVKILPVLLLCGYTIVMVCCMYGYMYIECVHGDNIFCQIMYMYLCIFII